MIQKHLQCWFGKGMRNQPKSIYDACHTCCIDEGGVYFAFIFGSFDRKFRFVLLYEIYIPFTTQMNATI